MSNFDTKIIKIDKGFAQKKKILSGENNNNNKNKHKFTSLVLTTAESFFTMKIP